MKGRRPNTHQFRLITGNRRRTPLPPRITPKAGAPEMPSHLSDGAKKIWPLFIEALTELRTLTPQDGFILEEICETYCEIHTLQKDVQHCGRFQRVETSTGDTKRSSNPNTIQLSVARKHYKSLLEQAGLTPLSRSKIQPIEEPSTGADPAAKYFG